MSKSLSKNTPNKKDTSKDTKNNTNNKDSKNNTNNKDSKSNTKTTNLSKTKDNKDKSITTTNNNNINSDTKSTHKSRSPFKSKHKLYEEELISIKDYKYSIKIYYYPDYTALIVLIEDYMQKFRKSNPNNTSHNLNTNKLFEINEMGEEDHWVLVNLNNLEYVHYLYKYLINTKKNISNYNSLDVELKFNKNNPKKLPDVIGNLVKFNNITRSKLLSNNTMGNNTIDNNFNMNNINNNSNNNLHTINNISSIPPIYNNKFMSTSNNNNNNNSTIGNVSSSFITNNNIQSHNIFMNNSKIDFSKHLKTINEGKYMSAYKNTNNNYNTIHNALDDLKLTNQNKTRKKKDAGLLFDIFNQYKVALPDPIKKNNDNGYINSNTNNNYGSRSSNPNTSRSTSKSRLNNYISQNAYTDNKVNSNYTQQHEEEPTNINTVLKNNLVNNISNKYTHLKMKPVKYKFFMLSRQQHILNNLHPKLLSISTPYVSTYDQELLISKLNNTKNISIKPFNRVIGVRSIENLEQNNNSNIIKTFNMNQPYLESDGCIKRDVEKKKWMSKRNFRPVY